MSFQANNRQLLDRLNDLSLQHDRDEAARGAPSTGQTGSGSFIDRQAALVAARQLQSPDFSSVSSEDPERGGGKYPNLHFPHGGRIFHNPAFTARLLKKRNTDFPLIGARLDASSLRGSPASFARRSEAGRALRPTSSATATFHARSNRQLPVRDEDDVFGGSPAKAEAEETSGPVVASSSSYTLNQSHIQDVDVKGKEVDRRNTDIGASPTKGPLCSRPEDGLDPQDTWPSTACIFVANLPENRDDWTIEAAVKHEFEKFGIVYVKIRRDPNGMPFAFVQFTNEENAQQARSQGKGALILGRPCRTETVRANRTYIIYRRNRSPITLEEANELLPPFGDLETVRFLDPQIQEQMRLPVTVRVQFKVFDPSQQVLRAFRMNKVYNVEAYDFKKAMQARARLRDIGFNNYSDRDSRSVFIGDLPLDFSEADVRALMEDVGGVVSVQLKRLDYHREGPKLIAFVEFTNPTLPDMAIEHYNNNTVAGSILRVERRFDRRRREATMSARIQNAPFNGPPPSNMGGRAPSTPAREQRGPLAIEAGAATRTPVRNESRQITGQTVVQDNICQTPQNAAQRVQTQMPTQQQPAGPAFNHVSGHVQAQAQAQAQAPNQGPVQFPMAPPPMAAPMAGPMPGPMGPHMVPPMAQMAPQMVPPMPPQMGTPMQMAPPNMGFSPYATSPYSQGAFSQGAFSQGPGSSYGFMTPQQSPGHFWGYGVGTPLWTPFPIDSSAYMAYTSPAAQQARSNNGMTPSAPAHMEPNQFTQSEPVMTDNTQADIDQDEVEDN